VKLLIVAAYVIVSVPGVTPLPTAEVRVMVMPPVSGNAKGVGVLSGRVEKPTVLGFDQMTSAEACVAVARTIARTRLLRKTHMSGPFVTAKFDSIVSARAGIPAAIISSVTAIVTMQRFLNRFMLTHSL
jgi:hypothetical protein